MVLRRRAARSRRDRLPGAAFVPAFALGLAALAFANACALAQEQAMAGVAASVAQVVPAPAPAPAPAAGTRVYLSVDRDGHATFSDHAQPGAAILSVRQYDITPDPRSQVRANAEREYWRARSDAFAQRQRNRERDLDLAMARASRTQPERSLPWADVPVRRYFRVSPAAIGAPPGAATATASPYQGGPGAASRAGAAFIGSGFAAAR